MGFLDKAKAFIKKNPDKVDQGIDKLGDMVDKATKGRHADKIDKAQRSAKKATRSMSDRHPKTH
ncbi:MAG: antitoxin [Corynebacteriales bacterium]|nr:antitoxin [Mycobacteriales bacterium]